MKAQNKIILITGGGRGIGYSIAKAFSGHGNQLILVGRNEGTLTTAVKTLEQASYIAADVASEQDVERLVKEVEKKYGGLDILVNNAGVGNPQPLDDSKGIYETAKYEMEINYLGVLRLTEKLLPLLKKSKEAAIINIESIVSYAPNTVIATYSATKAALHSYSLSLRLVLQRSHPHIEVFEVFPPFVDTDLTKPYDVPGKLSPDEVAHDILEGLASKTYEIRNGSTKDLYKAFLQSPEAALQALNAAERVEA